MSDWDGSLKSQAGEPLFVTENANVEISESEFARIRQILLFNRGFNLNAYKDKCIRRRIAIRVRSTHCESVNDYCDLLINHKSEIDKLVKVLTIHVSQFFRNLSTFEKLRGEIIPYLFSMARQKGKKSLRFWSLGCAGGEEPYSIALILAEHFSREMQEIPVRIDATDVDSGIIQSAENALFHHDRLLETPINYIQKYFDEEENQYRLSPSIRKMVSFSQGEMFNTLIYHECDLLLCRNVLIYLAREQQEKIFHNITRCLNENAFLVLGKSETILGESRSLFQTVCPVERIYRLAAAPPIGQDIIS
jgi:chemotaxis protein methyltransferase CheR